MYLDRAIEGKYCELRSIEESDAEFTLALRQDPEITQYLPRLDISLEQQKEWIKAQRERPYDYFWVMFDKEGNRFGTAGIYDMNTNEPKGRSLAAKGNPLQNIEGTYLAYKYMLDVFKVDGMYGYVYADNVRATRFNELLGAVIGEPKESNGIIIREVIFRQPEFGIAEKKVRRMLYHET